MFRFFRVFIPAGTITLLVSENLLIATSFILATYLMLAVDPTVFLLYDGGLVRILPVVLSILIGLHLQDFYSQVHVKSRILLAQQLCRVIGIAFLVQSLISYIHMDLRLPIRVMILGSLMALPAIFIWRVLYSAYALQIAPHERLLLVGGSPLLEDIGRHIEDHPETGLQVVGYVGSDSEAAALAGGKILGKLDSLRDIIRATRPDRIVVGMFERRNRVPVDDLLELRFAGHIIEEASSTYERVCGRVCLKEIRPSQLIYSGELGPGRRGEIQHALGNAALALFGIVVSAPIMLLTALAVRLSSPGPVLYRQVRVGRNGSHFTLYKFRSMRADAEASTGAVWASRNDPRATPVGRVIRKLRLDELPQLINVLKGEMSIVGPRPERPEFVQALSEKIPYYRQRHSVRPGITGWAQISYKYGDTLEDTIRKLEYDLYYIKNMSAGLDIYIIFHTVKAMLLSRGAQ
jgi:sugar transferase (PEP-CTERM system associated)